MIINPKTYIKLLPGGKTTPLVNKKSLLNFFKMKKRIVYFCLFFAGLPIISSCEKEEFIVVDKNKSSQLSAQSDENAKLSSSYDKLILKDKPVGYWLLTKGYQSDASGHGMRGTYKGDGRGEAILPNGETASVFNGKNNYFEIPDNYYQEVVRTGILTIEAWMRPDVVNFPVNETSEHYVHWMGKGTISNHLWAARMYNKEGNNRPQRISGYCFNLSGGLGAGSYFQSKDPISPGTWIHYALVINTKNTSKQYPTGYTRIYINGEIKDTDSLKDYNIIPGNSTAPMRVATRDLNSFFLGAIGKVAIYDRELSKTQLLAHNNKMRGLKF
ncbi:MAG: LamG domain-containing protein [Bacteroidota bacterium]|nr:LamG domain-containing protein [Bacteroidota bacterium]